MRNPTQHSRPVLYIIPECHIDDIFNWINETGFVYMEDPHKLPANGQKQLIHKDEFIAKQSAFFARFVEQAKQRLAYLVPHETIIYQEGIIDDIGLPGTELNKKFIAWLINDMTEKCPRSPFVHIAIPLLQKGASLVGIESAELLDTSRAENEAFYYKTLDERVKALGKHWREERPSFLAERDACMARHIEKTLSPGKIGILMIGALHHVEWELSENITVNIFGDLIDEYYEAAKPFM